MGKQVSVGSNYFTQKILDSHQERQIQIRMKVQSKEKLFKDPEKAMTAYEHLISGIDSMAKLHHIPSLGTLFKENTWEQVKQDIQAFLQPVRQVVTTPNLLKSQENLVNFILTPIHIYTKLDSLSNQVMIQR